MALVEPAGDDARPLDQEDHLLELAARVAPGSADRLGRRVEVGDDARAADLVARDDGDLLQGGLVGGGAGDGGRAAEEAVPVADVARDDAVRLEADGAVVELGHDPAHRPREAQADAVAPAHGLGEAQAADQVGRHVGDQVLHRAARRVELGEDELAAAVVAHDQVLHRDPLPAREAQRRLGGCSVGPEGRRRGRAADRAAGGRQLHREPVACTANLRGATEIVALQPAGTPAAASAWPSSCGACSTISRQALEGSSSQPTSMRRSGTGGLLGRGDQREVAPGAQVRQRAHPADVGGPLGDADGAAGVEQVEGVRALQAVVVGRQRQPGLEAAACTPPRRCRRGRRASSDRAARKAYSLISTSLRWKTSRYFTPFTHSTSKTFSTSCRYMAMRSRP